MPSTTAYLRSHLVSNIAAHNATAPERPIALFAVSQLKAGTFEPNVAPTTAVTAMQAAGIKIF